MTRYGLFAAVVLASTLLATPRLAEAAESYDNCTGFITSIPTVINTQGTWCLKQDLGTPIASGAAISINTNNVTLDCNDFKLGGLAAGLGTQTAGIAANNHINLTVRHCNVRGFYIGVEFYGVNSGSNLIEDNRFDSNTYVGILVHGDGTVVQRNRVFDTGGSTQAPGPFGIATNYSVDILDNTVSGVTATSGGNGYAYGISTNLDLHGRIIGNSVRGLVKDGTGQTYGIFNGNSDHITVRENNVVDDGGSGNIGLHCTGAEGSARDNVISGFVDFGIHLCTDSGGNDIVP